MTDIDFVELTKKIMKEVNTDMEWEQIIERALRVGFEAGKKEAIEENECFVYWQKTIGLELERKTAEKIFAFMRSDEFYEIYCGMEKCDVPRKIADLLESRFVGKSKEVKP